MKEQFVTYEIALKLKELGFNEPCFGYYKPIKDWMMKGNKFNSEPHFHGCNWPNNESTFYFMYVQNSFGDRDSIVKNSEFTKAIKNIAVPLWQQVVDWFREKHNIIIEILSYNCYGEYIGTHFKYIIDKMLEKENTYGEFTESLQEENGTKNYYEAREQAILKTIEVCQKKK